MTKPILSPMQSCIRELFLKKHKINCLYPANTFRVWNFTLAPQGGGK